MKKKLPIGISDFKGLIEDGCLYIDKSRFIKEVIDSPSQVLLLPRPRRFGKTLNLSMLRYFFEKSDEDRSGLFNGLNIQTDPVFHTHQGKYPVIFMTFKDVKHSSWKGCFNAFKEIIRKEYARHRRLMDSEALYPEEKAYVRNILFSELKDEDYEWSLGRLSEYLSRTSGEKAIILVDEYDTPIHAAYQKGFYDKLIEFIRNFLSGGLKDNPNLSKGVLTGILRVAKESVFSGLNNPGVYTILDREFRERFGFTEEEVRNLLETHGLSDRAEDVDFWYNGYLFGEKVIYNPWSVLQFVHRKPKFPAPYWANTADSGLIDRLATEGGREIRAEIGGLLEGGSVTGPVYDSIVMKDLDRRKELLWSFLLFSGYLKPAEQMDAETYRLEIPNREVLMIFQEMVRTWFAEKVESDALAEMIRSLRKGDGKLFEIMLRKIALQIMSFHDLAGEPEKVYHALVLGMLVWMSGEYDIRSNRESGYGRYDLMLKPKEPGGHGIVIEFKKTAEDEDPEKALQDAMAQIDNKQYVAELEASGVENIMKIAVAFRGKALWVLTEASEILP